MVHLYRIKGGPGDEGEDDEALPKIPMSQPEFSINAHKIGNFIFNRRKKVARGYMNSITDAEFITQTQHDEYKDIFFSTSFLKLNY